jgi:UDP-N-acetylglucosamine--N-acetylmuramyl-(pentapeptide) pyrophosphoryl-undecaprenol N-acetylglucosamine transferase
MNPKQNKFQTSNKTKELCFFYICGLTGGPYFPIPAIIKQVNENFPNAKNILIGVKNSYEQKIAETQNLNIQYLPKVKLDLLSFKNAKFQEIVVDFFKMILNVFKFVYSIFKCIFLILKYRPLMVYSTGSFLAVPIVWSTVLCNKIKITNTKIVIHQQDATLGLANKLTARFADLLSCTFQFTKENYPLFDKSQLISNPIITSKYNTKNDWTDKTLKTFVKTPSDKPLLLVFGGGTGALAINSWVRDNIAGLLVKFRIIHLTGSLQIQNKKINPNKDYYSRQAVFGDMPTLLASVNLVICRAGLGSISELALLNKQTLLVPIPNTHQVQNAQLISQTNSNFHILDQNNIDNWLGRLNNFTPIPSLNLQKFDQAGLNAYYRKLIELLKLDQK